MKIIYNAESPSRRGMHSRISRRLCVSALLSASLCFADSLVTRERGYWVQTLTGDQPLDQSRVQITASGSVSVTGAADGSVHWELKARLRAPNEADARRRLQAYRVKALRERERTVFVAPRDENTQLSVRVPRSLVETAIQTGDGAITVYDLAGGLHAATGGGQVRCDRIGGSLEVETGGSDIALGTVDGAAHCVTGGGTINAGVIGGDATFETGGGDIVAQEVRGIFRAATEGGAIRIGRAGSAVIANTAGGPIEVGEARGMVTAKNSGGPIQVGSANGVRCETAAGAIRLANVTGSLRASTAIGSIVARLVGGRPLADSFLTTGSGDITVVIPSNLAVTIRAQNELADKMSRIVSDFPGVAVRLQNGAVVAEGAINGGGPLLRIANTGGTIFIKRQ